MTWDWSHKSPHLAHLLPFLCMHPDGLVFSCRQTRDESWSAYSTTGLENRPQDVLLNQWWTIYGAGWACRITALIRIVTSTTKRHRKIYTRVKKNPFYVWLKKYTSGCVSALIWGVNIKTLLLKTHRLIQIKCFWAYSVTLSLVTHSNTSLF